MATSRHVEDSGSVALTGLDKAKPTLDELNNNLDTLWISYLNHLDAYASAQKLLQKHMKAGFLSLARANFEARSGVRKYGQDYYHDRAIATRRVAISTQDAEAVPKLDIIHWTPPVDDENEESDSFVEFRKTGDKEGDVTQLPSPPRTPEPEAVSNETSNDTAEPPETEPQKTAKELPKLPLEADALRWFGILVPASLRSAQASFVSAVNKAVAESTNSAKAMRSTEVEIRRLRKDIRKAEKEMSAA